jgi:hypothetical protein
MFFYNKRKIVNKKYMHELLNVRTSKVIRFAEDIHELTPDEYLFYLDLALKQVTGEITDEKEIKRALFVKITDLKVGWRMAWSTEDEEVAVWSALTEKINLLDSFFDIRTENDRHIYDMHLKSGANLLPTWDGLHGPEDMLNNMNWGEFVRCLNAVKMLNKAREQEDLAGIQQNTIELFETMYTGRRKSSKKPIPDVVLFHAINFFGYVYELISTVPIEINGEMIDFSIIWKSDDDETKEQKNKSGWEGILFAIAEAGIFGRTVDVNNTPLYEVLMYLYDKKHQILEEKKQQEKMNTNG